MAIEKNNGDYDLQCDFCCTRIEGIESFPEAVQYKKANGWRGVKINMEWFDKCPECLEREKGEQEDE